jgi:hypothetical protein
LVEQSIRNRQVIGSSPIVGSIYLSLRSKAPEIFRFFETRFLHLWHAARRVVGFAAIFVIPASTATILMSR